MIPAIVAHATNGIDHPELVAWRIKNFANVVGHENVVAGARPASKELW
jgi:5-methyltetrahydropteroyltriglutamate--homocysteine methyltransferase